MECPISISHDDLQCRPVWQKLGSYDRQVICAFPKKSDAVWLLLKVCSAIESLF